MNQDALRLGRYRFRATWRQRRGAYLSIVLLTGLVGGLAMGSLAAARRTDSSFTTFFASTNPSDLSLGTALWSPPLGYTTGYDRPLVRTISRLPHVARGRELLRRLQRAHPGRRPTTRRRATAPTSTSSAASAASSSVRTG